MILGFNPDWRHVVSFGACDGGYAYKRCGEFIEALRGGLRDILLREDAADLSFDDRDLDGQLDYAREDFDPADDWVSYDGPMFARMMSDLLEGAGGEPAGGSLSDGDMPGYCSAMSLLYADDHGKVVDTRPRQAEREVEGGSVVGSPPLSDALRVRLRRRDCQMAWGCQAGGGKPQS